MKSNHLFYLFSPVSDGGRDLNSLSLSKFWLAALSFWKNGFQNVFPDRWIPKVPLWSSRLQNNIDHQCIKGCFKDSRKPQDPFWFWLWSYLLLQKRNNKYINLTSLWGLNRLWVKAKQRNETQTIKIKQVNEDHPRTDSIQIPSHVLQ